MTHRSLLRRYVPMGIAAVALFPAAAAAPAQQRGFELASPAGDGASFVDGGIPGPGVGSPGNAVQGSTPDGSSVLMQTPGTLPGMAEDGTVRDYLIGSRGGSAWGWTAPLGDSSGVGCGFEGGAPESQDLSDDGAKMMLSLRCPQDKRRFGGAEATTGAALDQTSGTGVTLYRVDAAANTAEFIGTRYGADGPVVRSGTVSDQLMGSSPDLSTVVFATPSGLLPDVPDVPGALYIYATDGNGPPTLVTRTFAGDPFRLLASFSGILSGDRPGAVSDTAEAIAFTAQGSTNPATNGAMVAGDTNAVADAYQVRGGEVLWVSNPEAVPAGNRPATAQTPANRLHEGSSADGSRIFFSTTERMTGDDTDSVRDLYLHDTTEPADARISRVSVADPACGACDDNQSNTLGQIHSQSKFAALSADGSRIFFITGDALTEDDVDVQQSLYTHEVDTGATEYVAPAGAGVTSATNGTDAGTNTGGSLVRTGLLADYSERPIKVSPGGELAAFSLATNASLPPGRGGADLDSARDLFVWRAEDGLRRVRQGPGPDDNTLSVPGLGCYLGTSNSRKARCRTVTSDGSSLFFETTDSLTPEDSDGGQFDVYELLAADGSVELVSPPGDEAVDSRYVDSSESGADVFFTTDATVDPSRDQDSGLLDVYNARRGSVFDPLPPPPASCMGDSCQPSGPAAPGAPPVGSGDTVTPENVAPSERIRRSLGLVRPSRRAVRRMGRTGRLALGVRLTGGGTIRINARARVRVRVGGRIGVRSRRVARSRRRVTGEGTTTVRVPVRLSRKAKRQLRRKGQLGVRIRVKVSGLGTRGVRIVPRRPVKRRDRAASGRDSSHHDRKRG